MSLGTVASLKDNTLGYQPLFLCVVTLQGTNTPLLLSTHPLNSGEGGPAFPGVGSAPAGDYLGRLQKTDFSALQQRSQLGIDRVAQVTLHIADADHYIWTNIAQAYGFRGASLQIYLVMWQVGTSNFSSDAPLLFVGSCDMERPTAGGNVISVTANNGHNTATVKLPMFPVQNRCAHLMPTNAEQRAAALNDPSSPFYGCGYSADQGGGCGNTGPANHFDAFGNRVTDGAGVFVSCDYIRSNANDATSGCMARLGNAATTTVAPDGDLMHDQAGNPTGRFSGVEWSPGTYYQINKNYTSNTKIATFSFINSAILGQYQNLLYGTQWVTPKLANVIESGNDTKTEAMICVGDIGQYGVIQVVANGVQINKAPSGDKNLWWNFNNVGGTPSTGGRNGAACKDTGYSNSGHSALGDPYGSIATIEVVMYKDVFTGFGTPTIQVLASGPQLWVFSDQTTKVLSGAPDNYNPAWVLLDILSKANWAYDEIHMASFIEAAAFCSTQIDYFDQTGAARTHERFKCQFVLEQRRTAAEVIQAVLRSFNGYLYWGQDGLLNLGINRTLADEQSSPITGSNYNTAISSVHADGSGGSGYVAYSFDESNVARKSDGTPDLECEENATVQTPNQVSIAFQDEDNQFVQDSVANVDTDSTVRAGGALQPGGNLIPETLNVMGISNFDQAIRIGNVYLAERQRGNEAQDPRGTRVFTLGTTVRIEHLRVGHLVKFTWQAFGITDQLFRVIKIQPETDYETAKVTIQWHEDEFYEDLFGQSPQSFFSSGGNNRPQRAPLPWQPNTEAPDSNIYDATELNFKLEEVDTPQADGSVLVQLQLTGAPPVNRVTTIGPPLVPVQATTSASGGTIPGGTTLLMQLCAVDADGNYSAPSGVITAAIPTGTNTNTVTIDNLGWQHGSVGYDLFAGKDHFSITHQQSDSSTPSSITLTSLPNVLAYGAPDLAASSVYVQAKPVIHGGVIGQNIGAVDSTSITLGIPDGFGPLTNDFTGYTVTLVAKLLGGALPIADYRVTSNTGYQFFLDRDPTSHIGVGDVVLISAQADIASDTTIGCTNFVNVFGPTGTQDLTGFIVRIIAGTGRYQTRTIASTDSGGTFYTVTDPWDVIPDSTSMFIVEDMQWRDNSAGADYHASQVTAQTAISTVNVSNYTGQTMIVQALIGDPGDTKFSNELRSPFRMIYLFGQPGAPFGLIQIAPTT